MRVGKFYLIALGILFIFLACPTEPPDLEHSLSLYREGRLNEARRDMLAYLQAKPYNPESDEARQHILLIRRIKQLESIAMEQWRRGNTRGATKLVGIMRILHPVYVDSAEIFQLIDFSQPPLWADTSLKRPAPARLDLADSTTRELIPWALVVLERQESAIVHLAREWELARYRQSDNPVSLFSVSITGPETQALIQMVDSARERLRDTSSRSNPLVQKLDSLSEQFDQFLGDISSDTQQPLLSFEFGFQDHKRKLLMQILALKARLVAADTTGQIGS
ncbi:MAG: hypothetical protein JSU77_10460 [Fidelibacterota bacterium]|nr:MAG: hypothetical protein JSU77_10460 [Candidatus Neomarinimicrobiota bacterium]